VGTALSANWMRPSRSVYYTMIHLKKTLDPETCNGHGDPAVLTTSCNAVTLYEMYPEVPTI